MHRPEMMRRPTAKRQRGQSPPAGLVALLGLGLVLAAIWAVFAFGAVAVLPIVGLGLLAACGYWLEARSLSRQVESSQVARRVLLRDSLNLDLPACRERARRVMDGLHPGLEFIDPDGQAVADGWSFRFGLPTGRPEDPWEYLIGCGNLIVVNRHNGEARMPDHDELPSDWMNGKA